MKPSFRTASFQVCPHNLTTHGRPWVAPRTPSPSDPEHVAPLATCHPQERQLLTACYLCTLLGDMLGACTSHSGA